MGGWSRRTLRPSCDAVQRVSQRSSWGCRHAQAARRRRPVTVAVSVRAGASAGPVESHQACGDGITQTPCSRKSACSAGNSGDRQFRKYLAVWLNTSRIPSFTCREEIRRSSPQSWTGAGLETRRCIEQAGNDHRPFSFDCPSRRARFIRRSGTRIGGRGSATTCRSGWLAPDRQPHRDAPAARQPSRPTAATKGFPTVTDTLHPWGT